MWVTSLEEAKDPDFCAQEENCGYQVRKYVDSLVVQIEPACKAGPHRSGLRTIAVADVFVVLLPFGDFVKGKKN